MQTASVRLLHASDLHLERPVSGLAEVPDHLVDLLDAAPYQAAERVFDRALAESVDLVLLTGDVVDLLAAGPRAIVFLIGQFERLRAKNIAVYWASGPAERSGPWPTAIALPDNVHLLDSKHPRTVAMRDGAPLAEIVVRSNRLHAPPLGVPRICVLRGRAKRNALAAAGATYVALGGRHRRRTLTFAGGHAHDPGSPQARSPDEQGPHGCSVVEIDARGEVRTKFLATEIIAFHDAHLACEGDASASALTDRVLEHARQLLAAAPGVFGLVRYTIETGGRLAEQLRRTPLAGDVLAALRTTYGRQRPGLWTSSVECHEEHDKAARLSTEDSVLGNYLRLLRETNAGQPDPLDLARLMPPGGLSADPSFAALLAEPGSRGEILAEAAELGIELLEPEHTAP